MSDDVMVVTTNDVPGYEVVEVHGAVFGLVARSRSAFSGLRVGFRSLSGSEVKSYTRASAVSRGEALERLRDAARARGANAVLAMRFDGGELGPVVGEIAAYGTAVRVRRL
jgi:uncharacterized protein YbjQ (UPF0145 family)